MNSVTAAEIAQLQNMTVKKLAEKFESLIGEKCRSRNKRYLVRRLAWRIQADAEGGLSERARKRANELALTADVRVTPPKKKANTLALHENGTSKPVRDDRLPPAGSMLHREYKGKQIIVLVFDDTFEYEGQIFKSLTAVAKTITGSHVNGFQFFKLGGKQ